jgi:hypothetical protein
MEYEVEPASAEALCFKRVAELTRELGDIARNSIRGADRFGEDPTNFDQRRGADGLYRLAKAADSLVDAAAEFRTEPQRERRARLHEQIGDAIEAEDAQAVDTADRDKRRLTRRRATSRARVP